MIYTQSLNNSDTVTEGKNCPGFKKLLFQFVDNRKCIAAPYTYIITFIKQMNKYIYIDIAEIWVLERCGHIYCCIM